MKTISTLPQLLAILEISSEEDYKDIIHKIDIPATEFSQYEYWNGDAYTRNCILRTEKFELLLLCWEPGHETPIHCHNDQECWMYLVKGQMYEKQYLKRNSQRPLEFTSCNLKDDPFCHINDDIGLHSLHNSEEERSVSLHLYAKPIDRCSYYDEDAACFKTSELNYHTVAEPILY